MTIKKIVTGDFLTNTYLVENKGQCVLIDPGLDFEFTAKEILKKYEVKAILITHGHMDHIDGLQYFPSIPIYFPALEKAFLKDETLSLYLMFGNKMPFSQKDLNLIFVEDQAEIKIAHFTFLAIHTPGHTQGSMCYLIQNALLSGDTLFAGSVGRTDFPTGNSDFLYKSLKKITKMISNGTIIYPGHGDITTLKEELNTNPWLK